MPPDGPPQRSNKLTQARDRADDLADRILADLFAGIGNDFARNALNLPHAEPDPHQARANPHDAAHHPAKSAAFRLSRLHQRLGAWQLIDQRLDFVGRAFFGQEIEDDADGLLGDSSVYADGRDDASNQLVHGP